MWIKKIPALFAVIGIVLCFFSISSISSRDKTVIDVDSEAGGYSITYYNVSSTEMLMENTGVVLISISITLALTSKITGNSK